MRLLIVEDETALSEAVAEALRAGGYEVDTCADGDEARSLCEAEEYDLILLDLGLPGADGIEVLQSLRRFDTRTAVLVLSARSQVADKVEALDLGANDYLTKPFDLPELEARIRSLTRRRFDQPGVVLSCGGISFDTRSRTAFAKGEPVALTRKEGSLLEYLLIHQDTVVSPEELIEHVWGSALSLSSNSVRVHISSLRRKLRGALGRDPIHNSVGHGYSIRGTAA